ncbi:MAG: 23S rRNA (uracil(1939)-C(5))-methyltransferase RlmD [Bacteroidetes bacterium]|nr:23S rRNA (uracil(1939)-C(5))-methyltransferase RlmD [Bacteroidota bacterium]
MGRRNPGTRILEQVVIGPAVSEGNCISRIGEQVLFVKYAAPGDVADVQVTRFKKNFMEGKVLKIHSASPLRTEPFCAHFGTCGGCKWQHLDYGEQLKSKQQQVTDALERIGGLSGFEVLPIVGSGQIAHYRNKLDLTFSHRAWHIEFNPENPQDYSALGFHIPGRFDKVLDIENCHLMPAYVNVIQRGIKKYCDDNGYEFFDLYHQTGFLRNLLLRCNAKGEWMVLVAFAREDVALREKLLNYIRDTFENIASLVYVINEKRNDTLADLIVHTYSGQDHLIEELEGLKFKIRPQSFFQTNTRQAEILYRITRDFAALSGEEKVYDLYTGTGSIALFVAAQAREVIGIEYVPEAIMDAHENAEMNGIAHVRFFAGDMKQILTPEFIREQGRPDVVITDPPRDGMHPDVVQRLLEMEANRIVYVSCNPATQARDARLLAEKYTLVKVQPVDMFPHTHHVENVGLWVLNE